MVVSAVDDPPDRHSRDLRKLVGDASPLDHNSSGSDRCDLVDSVSCGRTKCL